MTFIIYCSRHLLAYMFCIVLVSAIISAVMDFGPAVYFFLSCTMMVAPFLFIFLYYTLVGWFSGKQNKNGASEQPTKSAE